MENVPEKPEKKPINVMDLIGKPLPFELLDKEGLTDEAIVKAMAEEFKAVGIGGTPLWGVRREARRDISRIKGHFPPELKGDAYIQIFNQNNVVISPVVREILASHCKAMSFDESEVIDVKEIKK